MPRQIQGFARFQDLGDAITSFWLRPQGRAGPTWQDHLNINEVMLATSILPDGYLDLRSPESHLAGR